MHPSVHFVFLFDHSSGHTKQRPDGLNASKMNKLFGGKYPVMHPTVIERESGFLGPYARILETGQTQPLTFTEMNARPFWMTPNNCILSCLDQVDGNPSINQRTKSELILELHCQGIYTKGKKELIAFCINKKSRSSMKFLK